MATPTYVNTRIRKSPDGSKWIVEGQSASTYNWDTLMSYPMERERSQERAIDAACKLARDFSRKSRQAVTAYNVRGNAVAAYLKGEPYKKN